MKSLQILEDLHICQYCNSHINIFDTSKTVSNKENNVCSIHIMSKTEIKLGLNVYNLLYFFLPWYMIVLGGSTGSRIFVV